jgi:hypothetical protein
MIETPDNLIPADIDLVGIDGNAFSVMGTVIKGLKSAGNEDSVIKSYQDDAMSGDYDHLLAVSLAYTSN